MYIYILQKKEEKTNMNNEEKKELIKKKINEKDEAKKKYREKLELIKQHYGVDFIVDYYRDENINKIKFVNLEYKTIAKNISIVYDNKIGKFNYLTYDYTSNSSFKNMTDKKLITALNREKKLKLIIAEITRLNKEYQLELENIDRKYKELERNKEEIGEELIIKKKLESS